jgi:group II intron reverse transcriptase/maturase
MKVDALLPYLETRYSELVGRIRKDEYRPVPVQRVEMPKPGGGVRNLGVPTVIDRMVQQAVAQVIVPIYEKVFSDHSYGFRPGRSAHDAIREARGYYEMGYTHVVDIDMAKFFDTLNHDILMSMLKENLDDWQLRRLIFRFLKAGVFIRGLKSPSEEGTPQGGPLSPVLSNIYLTKFDKLLEEKGLKFVRYADDLNIYVKSHRAALRVLESSTRFLEGTLKLKVNQDKSMVGSPLKLKFLGFTLGMNKDGPYVRIHEKSQRRFKDKVKTITRRNRGRSVKVILLELRRYVTGWMGYYRLAALKTKLKEYDGWVRRRMRTYIWKQWKTVRNKFKNLRKLGIGRETAWMWANTRKGHWRISGSQVLSMSMTNKYLEGLGLLNMSELFARVKLTA